MPSDTAMRVWTIGSVVLLWVMLRWIVADLLFWSTDGTPQGVIYQLLRRGQLMAGASERLRASWPYS